jgi:hypothetical protein
MSNSDADDRAFEAAWKACSSWDGKITKPVLRKAIAAAIKETRAAALEEAAKLIEEGFDRPGIVKKQDTCAHGKFGWEDCESCAAAAIRALIPPVQDQTP